MIPSLNTSRCSTPPLYPPAVAVNFPSPLAAEKTRPSKTDCFQKTEASTANVRSGGHFVIQIANVDKRVTTEFLVKLYKKCFEQVINNDSFRP